MLSSVWFCDSHASFGYVFIFCPKPIVMSGVRAAQHVDFYVLPVRITRVDVSFQRLGEKVKHMGEWKDRCGKLERVKAAFSCSESPTDVNGGCL